MQNYHETVGGHLLFFFFCNISKCFCFYVKALYTLSISVREIQLYQNKGN